VAEIDTGVLYRDDNLERLASFPSDSVDLIYLDPPFFSNRSYEVVWGDEAEVRSFEDRWEGGINHYIGWMNSRVTEMHRVLKHTGSLYLHCDPHASHYLKIMLDAIFGQSMFRNEVIWKRTTAHNSAKRYGPIHDVILYYTKSNDFTWVSQYQPYDEKYVASKYRFKDDRGRYRLSDLTGSGVRQGESGEPWRGYEPSKANRHWAVPSYAVAKYEEASGETIADLSVQERLEKLNEAGYIYWPKKPSGRPELKRHLADMPGVPSQDVWVDIDPINARAQERLGYPTQKPEALLERLVAASSRQGDLVLDPFCGCGTTVAVAEKLRREWIGIDISPTAIEVMRRRLLKAGVSPFIENAPDSIQDLKDLKPFEFQNWIINAMNGVHSSRQGHDMGIDGYSFFTRDPIQVKQSEHVGRNVVDNFETAIRRSGDSTGYVIGFSFTRGASEEAARARSEGLNIRLIKVAEVLLSVKRPGSSKKLGPQPASVVELPLPPVRKPNELPTAGELVASDLGTAAG
jgi:DNA modification methylase